MEEVKVEPVVTPEQWKKVFENGAKTLLEDLEDGKHDLNWYPVAIECALINQALSTPFQETEAHAWLKRQRKIPDKEELRQLLTTFITKIEF